MSQHPIISQQRYPSTPRDPTSVLQSDYSAQDDTKCSIAMMDDDGSHSCHAGSPSSFDPPPVDSSSCGAAWESWGWGSTLEGANGHYETARLQLIRRCRDEILRCARSQAEPRFALLGVPTYHFACGPGS
ncbi:hypothetical protein CSAL01_11143 [Colletotrichum salicis]|uniref:Uncharacterized protein n=1 Tax=Colletotrichum salicis TaxID=1209931 RepID=A0A135UMB0_9PEZI|nr:hypothetical protein CSAL01_11143 [Colletotrichum salicis]